MNKKEKIIEDEFELPPFLRNKSGDSKHIEIKKYDVPDEIQYEELKNSYITKEQAIAIAASDRNLKDSIYIEAAKKNMYYGLIIFKSFKVGLVKYKNSTFYWHVIVTEGDWGATEKEGRDSIMCDGEFTIDDDISCIISCDNGEYYYKDEYDINDLSPASIEEYNDYCKKPNMWVD